MTQCSRRPDGLPASLVLLILTLAVAPRLAAQDQRYRVARQEAFRQEAGAPGRTLATIPVGTEVAGGSAVNGWIQVALEGWIWSGSVARANRDGHNLMVTAPRGENLRTGPNGGVIARLLSGF